MEYMNESLLLLFFTRIAAIGKFKLALIKTWVTIFFPLLCFSDFYQ